VRKLLNVFGRWATPRNALIVLVLFLLNTILLDALDRPLLALASGEPKLDLRFGYDLATVEMLFGAYGEQGRAIYGWNLLVDTPFPVLGGLATVLFIMLAVRRRRWQASLVVPPLLFIITDLVENVLLFSMVQSYPSLSPGLVELASFITQVKRAAFYISAVELILSVLVVAAVRVREVLSPASSG